MQNLTELERRITAALARIGDGISGLSGGAPGHQDEVARLQAELDAERKARAALQDRLDALADARTVDGATAGAVADGRVESLTRQLDVQGIEMVRLRKTVGTLRENLRALRAAQVAGAADPAAINRAMQAELDAIRAERLSEMAELDEIIAELDPLIAPAAAPLAEENREDA